jgi:hypothetical protein
MLDDKHKDCIPKLYKRNLETIGLYFWIEGQKRIVPAITIQQCIDSFMKYNGFTVDGFNAESAMVTYYQMKKEFYESQRTVK